MYQTQFKAFKFYNKKGQRLAIYGEVKDKGGYDDLEIFILRCSKEDRFDKQKAEEIYSLYKQGLYDKVTGAISRLENRTSKEGKGYQEMVNYHPQFYRIPIRDEKKPRKEFIDFVVTHFYKKQIAYRFELLLKEEDIYV